MTNEQTRLSRRYVLYRMFSNMWFVGAVWLFFYRIFINDQQVGLLDGMSFAIGLLAEVPSGALADKFGRDRMVRLGQILAGGGILLQAIGGGFVPIFIGQAVFLIGLAFTSGADDALFFERLKFNPDSTDWRKLVTRGSQYALAATLVATALGGWLHTVNPRLPWLFNGLALLVSAALIWPIRDGRPKAERGNMSQEITSYLQDIKTGFAQFRLSSLRPYVPVILALQGLFYAVGYGLLRVVLLDRFTFSPFWGALVVTACGVITIGVLALMRRYADNQRETTVILAIAAAAASALLLALADIGMWGFIVILALHTGEYVLQPFMSEILNKHAPEDQRATVLSVASFIKMLPYTCLAPLIGYLNLHGQLNYFLIAWTALIGVAISIYLAAKRRDAKLSLRAAPTTRVEFETPHV